MKRPVVIVACASLALAAGAWLWQARQTAARVADLLPPLPDLAAAPAQLRERIKATDVQARSLLSAKRGFGELAALYHANGFLDEATRCYAGLQTVNPKEPRWPHLQATILAGYGDMQPALALWQKVVELAPDYVPARLRLADCLFKTNQRDAATAAYEAVLQRDRDNSYAQLGLARLDLEAGRLDQARARLEQVVTKSNYTLGYDLIVSLYEQMGLAQRATAIRAMAKASGAYRDPADPWLDDLITVCFEPYRLSLAAGTTARNGDAAQALQLLERAVSVAPDDVSVRFQLGTLLVAQGELDAGRAQLETCTALAPDFADGWAHLSSLLAQQGRVSDSRRVLAEGLKHCPLSPGLHLAYARDLQQTGRIGEAIAEFEKSIELRPNEADAPIELARLYAQQGREADALREFARALEAEPGHPVPLGVLAFHAITTADEAEAKRWLARVRNQPRVESDQLSRLVAAYQKRFGRAP